MAALSPPMFIAAKKRKEKKAGRLLDPLRFPCIGVETGVCVAEQDPKVHLDLALCRRKMKELCRSNIVRELMKVKDKTKKRECICAVLRLDNDPHLAFKKQVGAAVYSLTRNDEVAYLVCDNKFGVGMVTSSGSSFLVFNSGKGARLDYYMGATEATCTPSTYLPALERMDLTSLDMCTLQLLHLLVNNVCSQMVPPSPSKMATYASGVLEGALVTAIEYFHQAFNVLYAPAVLPVLEPELEGADAKRQRCSPDLADMPSPLLGGMWERFGSEVDGEPAVSASLASLSFAVGLTSRPPTPPVVADHDHGRIVSLLNMVLMDAPRCLEMKSKSSADAQCPPASPLVLPKPSQESAKSMSATFALPVSHVDPQVFSDIHKWLHDKSWTREKIKSFSSLLEVGLKQDESVAASQVTCTLGHPGWNEAVNRLCTVLHRSPLSGTDIIDLFYEIVRK